jgi:hypothetical protein
MNLDTMNLDLSFCFSAIHRITGYDRLILKWWWAFLPIIAFMVLLACWRVLVSFVLWYRKPRSRPKNLFLQLARVHRLTTKEKSLLAGLAAKLPKGMPPAILFADPTTWTWKQDTDPKVMATMEKMYAKIFGFPREPLGN